MSLRSFHHQCFHTYISLLKFSVFLGFKSLFTYLILDQVKGDFCLKEKKISWRETNFPPVILCIDLLQKTFSKPGSVTSNLEYDVFVKKMWRHIFSSPSLTQIQVQVLGTFRLGMTLTIKCVLLCFIIRSRGHSLNQGTSERIVYLFVCLGFEDPSNHWTKRMANTRWAT